MLFQLKVAYNSKASRFELIDIIKPDIWLTQIPNPLIHQLKLKATTNGHLLSDIPATNIRHWIKLVRAEPTFYTLSIMGEAEVYQVSVNSNPTPLTEWKVKRFDTTDWGLELTSNQTVANQIVGIKTRFRAEQLALRLFTTLKESFYHTHFLILPFAEDEDLKGLLYAASQSSDQSFDLTDFMLDMTFEKIFSMVLSTPIAIDKGFVLETRLADLSEFFDQPVYALDLIYQSSDNEPPKTLRADVAASCDVAKVLQSYAASTIGFIHSINRVDKLQFDTSFIADQLYAESDRWQHNLNNQIEIILHRRTTNAPS